MTVTIPYVDAHKITDKMSIRIVRLNGRSAETAARENAVHIMTEANYARVFEQQLNMVSVSGGTFMMGGNDKDEQPYHKETVAPFYMGKYEVTEGEYNIFLRATGRKGADSHYSDDWPVSGVTWYDAVRYCNWLSEMTGRTPAYKINRDDKWATGPDDVTWKTNADGYRLPTEAEWEYACRAGTTTAYSFGNSISGSQANYDERGKTRVQGRMPVGSFAPNPWGFYDMHGNVWEWCWDYHNAYGGGAQRANRGGGYLNWSEYLRSAFRHWSNPRSSAGFRIVAPAKTRVVR
jgi:formylglycine-generating enzyme required for sulfatase activity